MNTRERQQQRDNIKKDIDLFLESGGNINIIPIGVSAELKKREKPAILKSKEKGVRPCLNY